MHVSLDLEELPPSLRRSLARWPRAQLPAVLIRLVELGLYQVVRPNDFNPRSPQLHDWLQQHQIKTSPRMSFNSYNTFVQSPVATWVACPTANSRKFYRYSLLFISLFMFIDTRFIITATRRVDNELSIQSPTNNAEISAKTDITTDESTGQGNGFFSMLTAKLFGIRKPSAITTATTMSDNIPISSQYESDKSKSKKNRKKTKNQPSFSLRHIRNLSLEIGSPSNQGECTLSQ